jgi:hypothetical protein
MHLIHSAIQLPLARPVKQVIPEIEMILRGRIVVYGVIDEFVT